jgi:hypothetical protein
VEFLDTPRRCRILHALNKKNIMKNLLFSCLFIATAFFTKAQSEIYVDSMHHTFYLGSVLPADFNTHDFAGEVLDVTPMGNPEIVIYFGVENNTGSLQTWRISRTRIGVDTNWVDYLCWGLTGGLCIPAGNMDVDIWEGFTSQTFLTDVPDGGKAVASVHIDPDLSFPGCGLYRYYIGTEEDAYIDSIDVNVCFSLGIDEQELPSLTIAPNPASDKITISGSNSGTLQLVNTLGQVVYESDFANESIIDVNGFEAGMYFAILHAEGVEPIKQKIIIE